MECRHFGECNSCQLYAEGYSGQLAIKQREVETLFSPYYAQESALFESQTSHYRARAEFRVWHEGDELYYAMTRMDKQGVFHVKECPMVNDTIATLMQPLLDTVKEAGLGEKLFGIDFLTSSGGDVVVSMLYHRALDDAWHNAAEAIAKQFGISIIGRSRKQKRVIGGDSVTETLQIRDKEYRFTHIENSFTQPNARVNEKMIGWATGHADGLGGDLLELYCGAGNFTIPFAEHFERVLATEISKSSIKAAKENTALNGVENITFVRMSSEEIVAALNKERPFNRLKGIDLDSFRLGTLFVDPPRSGLDDFTRRFASGFDTVIYISCNPTTCARDMEELSKTHHIVDMALFDQFPYTHHIEMGIVLKKQ